MAILPETKSQEQPKTRFGLAETVATENILARENRIQTTPGSNPALGTVNLEPRESEKRRRILSPIGVEGLRGKRVRHQPERSSSRQHCQLRGASRLLQTEQKWEFAVQSGEMRLDRFLAAQQVGLTRSRLHALIEAGLARLNGRLAKPAQKVRLGDRVTLTVPPPQKLDLVAQPIPLTVVYEDAELIVIDKPAGLSVHPGPGHPDGTLVNAILARCPDIQGVGGTIRPGIVHRLDKDTSGLMVVAKTERAHHSLSAQIKDRAVTKGYLALATGVVEPPQGRIDMPIARDPRHRQRMAVVPGGRQARTCYRVLEAVNGYSLLEVYLETGRTHQVRVHLAYLGHPLLGDGVYGRRSPLLARHFLHAHHLGFRHPATGDPLELRSDLPEDLHRVIEALK